MSKAYSLNGDAQILEARVLIPAWGCWTADIVTDAKETAPRGAATIVLEDLTLKGTIIMAGTANSTRTTYRIVGGAGGWGRSVAGRAYANDLGVTHAIVAGDAAREVGETLGTVPAGKVGVSFVRHEGPAARVLDELWPRDWYVDAAGVTQIGRRPQKTLTTEPNVLHADLGQGRIEVASPRLAELVPGVVVRGVEAMDVEHILDGEGKLRTWLLGRSLADGLRRMVEVHTDHHKYFGAWEYRVVQRRGERYDLQVVRVSSGMPDLLLVPVRTLTGVRVRPPLGSTVLVRFVNGDPARPVIVSFDEFTTPAASIADEIALMAGTTGAEPTEHATSAEALVLFVYQALVAMGALIAPTPVTALQVKGAIATALALYDVPVKPKIGDIDVVPGETANAIAAALNAKTTDTAGDTPGLGWPKVKGS